MSARQLRAVALGLAGLLLLWFASELLSKRSDRITASLALAPVSEATTDRVTITRGADTAVLAKGTDTAWTVNGYAASRQAMTDLFAALRDSTPAELAAESPGSFARLGVDSMGGRWIRVAGGGCWSSTAGSWRWASPRPGRLTRSGRDGPRGGRRCGARAGACCSPSRSIPPPAAPGCTAPTGPRGPCTAWSPGPWTS